MTMRVQRLAIHDAVIMYLHPGLQLYHILLAILYLVQGFWRGRLW